MIAFKELEEADSRKDALNCLDKKGCKLCGLDKEVKIYLLRYNSLPTSLFTMCGKHSIMLSSNLDKLTSAERLTEVIELTVQDIFTLRVL